MGVIRTETGVLKDDNGFLTGIFSRPGGTRRGFTLFPGVETPGYFQDRPSGTDSNQTAGRSV